MSSEQKKEKRVVSDPGFGSGVWEHTWQSGERAVAVRTVLQRFKARIYHDECSSNPGDWGNEDLYLAPMKGDFPRDELTGGTTQHDEEKYLSWKDWASFHGCPWINPPNPPPEDWYESEDEEREECYEMYTQWKDCHSEAYAIFPCRYVDCGSRGSMLHQCDADEMNCAVLIQQPASKLERLGTVLSGFCPTQMAADYVEEWNTWLRGEVYGYALYDSEGEDPDDELDSCWGFLGLEHCEEEAESALRSLAEKTLNDEMAEAGADAQEEGQ